MVSLNIRQSKPTHNTLEEQLTTHPHSPLCVLRFFMISFWFFFLSLEQAHHNSCYFSIHPFWYPLLSINKFFLLKLHFCSLTPFYPHFFVNQIYHFCWVHHKMSLRESYWKFLRCFCHFHPYTRSTPHIPIGCLACLVNELKTVIFIPSIPWV